MWQATAWWIHMKTLRVLSAQTRSRHWQNPNTKSESGPLNSSPRKRQRWTEAASPRFDSKRAATKTFLKPCFLNWSPETEQERQRGQRRVSSIVVHSPPLSCQLRIREACWIQCWNQLFRHSAEVLVLNAAWIKINYCKFKAPILVTYLEQRVARLQSSLQSSLPSLHEPWFAH